MKNRNRCHAVSIAGLIVFTVYLFEPTLFADGPVAPEVVAAKDSETAIKELQDRFHKDPVPWDPGIRPAIPPAWQKILENRCLQHPEPVHPDTEQPLIPTSLPREPELRVLEGSTAGTFLTQQNSSEFELHYDLTPSATSKSGAVLSFDLDNLMQVIDVVDLSNLEGLIFGLQSDNSRTTQIRVEITSAGGGTAVRTFSLTTEKTFVTLDNSFLSRSIDLAHVYSIRFYLDRDLVPDPHGHQGTVTISVAGNKKLANLAIGKYPGPTFKGKENTFQVQKTTRPSNFGGSAIVQVTKTTSHVETVSAPKPKWRGSRWHDIGIFEKDVKSGMRKNKDRPKRYADREMRRGGR